MLIQHQKAVDVMDKALDNYFSILFDTGYIPKQETVNLIGWLFLQTLLKQQYPIMCTGEYSCLKYAASRIAENSCLIPKDIC